MKLFLGFIFVATLCGKSGEISDSIGTLPISVPSGSTDSPSYSVVSAGVKNKVVFRGQVKQVNGNNIKFYRVPNLLDPTLMSWPFRDGMLACNKARAVAVLSSDKSILRIDVNESGAGYLSTPRVSISLPTDGNHSWHNNEQAFATAVVNSGSVVSISLDSNYSGMGYQFVPNIEIEGGVHFIRNIEENSEHAGKFFRISSNTGDTLTLDNTLSDDLNSLFPIHSMVEVFESWTLGSLLGYSETFLNEGNDSVADYVYLIKPIVEQNGTIHDYSAYFHDGVSWKKKSDPTFDASGTIIYPDESFILARRSSPGLEFKISGVALSLDSYVQIPAEKKRFLMNNPFGVDVMLSDLIPNNSLTLDVNETKKWYVNANQETADNVEVLKNGVWTTYWNDGTNMGITSKAFITARRGTGVAGSMTLRDISMSSGEISNMSNPNSGNIVVTSPGHSLKRGFTVHISNAYGYKTNNDTPKQLIDFDGNVVSNEADKFLIYSSANGFFEITNVTTDTFELLGKSGNCNFEGTASWRTGSKGSGYDSNAYVAFIGGGGRGAEGIAVVSGGSVQSVIITSPGYGYTSAPKVLVFSGGWRCLGSGNAPFNDALVPAASGILLTRNHPNGQSSSIRVSNPLRRF
ncbi:hypothetical protein N9N13_00510 [Opitutales bacterium]|nr:hypothetical protein [Opitutales bacterium]